MVLFCLWSVQQKVMSWGCGTVCGRFWQSLCFCCCDSLHTAWGFSGCSWLECPVHAAFSPLGHWASVCITPKKMMGNVLFYLKTNNQIGCKGNMVRRCVCVCVCEYQETSWIHIERVWIEAEEAIRLIPLHFPRKRSHHAELKLGLQPADEVTTWTAELQSILCLLLP